jgi:hypothetical protein
MLYFSWGASNNELNSISKPAACMSFGYNPISFAIFVFGVAEVLGNGSITVVQSVMISYPSLVW